jgi:hypothetical protein
MQAKAAVSLCGDYSSFFGDNITEEIVIFGYTTVR